jgi:hypothetical protein
MRAGASSIALGSLCFLVAIAGCGGGGGSNSGLPATAPGGSTPAGSTSTTATPTPAPYPSSNGTALVYSGTLTQTFQSFPEVVAPGSPSPEPTSVTTENVTQQVTVLSNQAFNGGSGLTDLHSVETDAYTSGLKSTTSTTDTFETVAQSGSSQQLLNYGSQYQDEAGDTMTTSYAPQRIEDELPETGGAQWSNGAGATVLQAIAGDSAGSAITVSRTVSTSGTYSETTTYPQGYEDLGYTGTGNIQENADGSGSYGWVANQAPITIEFGAPRPQVTGAPLIPIAEYAYLDPPPGATPADSFTLPDWYGFTPAFYNESDLDLGTVAVPSSCKLSSTLPQSATAIQETISRTDTILGYTEQEVQTSYVSGSYGPVCTTLQDTQTLYYDYNGDQPYVFTTVPPLEIASIAETLALQPQSATTASTASTTKISAATKTSASATTSTPFDVAPALRARFDRAVEDARRRVVTAMARSAMAARKTARPQGV